MNENQRAQDCQRVQSSLFEIEVAVGSRNWHPPRPDRIGDKLLAGALDALEQMRESLEQLDFPNGAEGLHARDAFRTQIRVATVSPVRPRSRFRRFDGNARTGTSREFRSVGHRRRGTRGEVLPCPPRHLDSSNRLCSLGLECCPLRIVLCLLDEL